MSKSKTGIFVATSSAIFSGYYATKHFTTKIRCLQSVTSPVEANAIFSEWISNWFKGVKIKSPTFKVPGKCIKVLSKPEEFYKTLLVFLFYICIVNLKHLNFLRFTFHKIFENK